MLSTLRSHGVLAGTTIGVGLILMLAASNFGSYNQASYEIVAGIMNRGGHVYAETIRYNYSPVSASCLLALHRLSALTVLPFPFCVRGFLTVVDIVDAALIGSLAQQYYGWRASRGFILYMLNPVSTLLTGYRSWRLTRRASGSLVWCSP